MTSAADVVLFSALAVTAGVLLLVLYVAIRRGIRSLVTRRLEGRITRAQAILREHQRAQFEGMDRLLFQLGEVQDLGAVETALADLLEQGTPAERLRLRKIYDSLGVTQRYLHDLTAAPKWVDRAAAARALGQLAVAEAVAPLLEVMRDPHEDERTVKLAAAQALAALKVPEVIPLLVAQLGTRDQFASPRVAEVLADFGPAAVPALLEALGDETNTNARVWAAQILGKIGDPSAAPALLARLRDRTEQVRISCAEALGRLGDRQAVNDLVQLSLRDPVPPVRAEAARALGQIGDEDAVRSLVLLLSDPDYWTRLRVVEAIELLRPKDVSMLDAALRDPSREVKMRAAVALERVGVLGQRAEELAGEDRGAIERAHRTLVEMGRAGLIESLLSLTESESFRLRSRIAEVLGEVGDPKAIPSLLPMLKDPMWPVRLRAVEAIGRIHPPNAVQLLVPALTDAEESVRAQAVQAFRGVGAPADDQSLEQVVALFDTANAEVRAAVVDAVGHLERPAIDALMRRALVDPNDEVRICAMRAVRPRVSEAWVPLVKGCLATGATELRVAAAEALGQVASPAALQCLVNSIATPERSLREVITDTLGRQGIGVLSLLEAAPPGIDTSLGIAWTLGKTSDPDALPRLEELSEDPEPAVRAAAAGALAKISHGRSAILLERLVGDRNERVRAAAVNALGAIGSVDVIPILLRAAKDPDAFVRRRVPIAIGRLEGPHALAALEALKGSEDSEDFELLRAIGMALTGEDAGVENALSVLSDPERRRRIEALIAQEMPQTGHSFRLRLQLPNRRSEELTSIDPAALSSQYAEALRAAQNAGQRLLAVRALKAMGTRAHADVLIDAVRTDPDVSVRKAAVEALGAEPATEAATRAYLDALRDPTSEVQVAAVQAIQRLSSPMFNEPLFRCYFTKDPTLEDAVTTALAYANCDRLVAFLDELMGRGEQPILRGGARVLGELGDHRAVPLLSAWLRGPSAELRGEAVLALGRIHTEQARSAVLTCATDPQVEVRLRVVEALSHMPGPKTYAGLATMIRDPAVSVREALARALGLNDDLAALTIAKDLTRDPEDSVRVEALLSLARLGGSDGLVAFNEAFADQNPAVQRALTTFGGKHPAAEAARKVLKGELRGEARAAALSVLMRIGAVTDLELEVALSDPAPELRLAAIDAADLERHQDVLSRLLRDPDPRVRDKARRRRLSVVDDPT